MAFLESNCIRTALTPSVLNRCNTFSCGNEDLDSFFNSCKKDSPYVLLYCDVAEYRCDDSESPVSVAKLREFLSCFTCFEWDSSSWISKYPDFYSEKTVKAFTNGVVEFSAKETNESPKHFMLIPGEVWDGIDYE